MFVKENISRNVNWDTGAENIIKNNILIGNFEGAIDAAMKCGRTVEALLLAYSKSSDLFEDTMKSYFLCSKDTFVKSTIRLVVEKNLNDLVFSYDLTKWKEILALIISNAKPNEQKSLFQKLISRFGKDQKQNKFIVSVLAKDFNFILNYFADSVITLKPQSFKRKIALTNVIQKISIISSLYEEISSHALTNTLLLEFA